jgi:hypothetical protein
MNATSAISALLLSVIVTAASAAPQGANVTETAARMTVSKAEKIALKEFRKRSHEKPTKVSARLLEDNDKDWVFVVEDAAQLPAPGSELYVTVNKKTAKAESYFGK